MKSLDMQKRLGLIAAIFVAACLFTSVHVLAYEYEMPAHRPPAEFSESDINSFVRVQGQITQIQQDYSARLHDATDESERQQVIEQANRDMISIIEAEGLSVERFNEILAEAQANPELAERINRAVQEALH